MKRSKIIWVCFLLAGAILVSCMSACQIVERDNDTAEEYTLEIAEEPLVLYMPVQFIRGNTEDLPTLYVSKYRLGECWNYTINSTLYASAIETFSSETGQQVEIVYFDSQYSLEAQLEQDMQAGTLPDVVLCDASATQAVYAYTQEEYAVNLWPYLQEKENEMYYSTILEAGRRGEQQFILPLLFNLSAVFTAKEMDQNYIGCEDLLTLLEEEINHLFSSPAVQEAVYAVPTGNPITISYILWNALGLSSYDESLGYPLEEEQLQRLFNWIYRYMQFEKDFEKAAPEGAPYRSSYISDSYLQSFLMAPSAETAASYYKDYENCISYFIDGASGCGWPATSMAVQAQFYSSQLEDFSLLPISKQNESETYHAAITEFGFVLSQGEEQEAAIQLLLFLQDYAVDPRFGFSVNKEVTQSGLETLTTTHWELYTQAMSGQVIGEISPLSNELKDQICASLEFITSASLPNGTLELDIMGNALLQYIEDGNWEVALSQLRKGIESLK